MVLYIHRLCTLCYHACISQSLGAKVEFPERREIANTFTNIPVHFQYII